MHAGIYRHYKGGYYQVLGVGAHSDTNELLVVYVSLTGAHLSGPRMRVRPLTAFMENDIKMSDGTWAKRFEYVGDEIPQTID